MSNSEKTGAATAALPASKGEPEMKGWLMKWTNYLKGYQRRWFVLSNGVLSYYRTETHGLGPGGAAAAGMMMLPLPPSAGSGGGSGGGGGGSGGGGGGGRGAKYSIRRRRKTPRHLQNQAEMSHTCRGTISLHGALIHTVDSCTFVISNGGTQTFHIKANNEVERQSWVTALELAKAKAIRTMESEEEEEDNNAMAIPSEELKLVIRDLTSRLENLSTCFELITKHGSALQRALTDLEGGEGDMASRSKIVSERATLFRISANAMKNACSDYLQTAQNQGHKWSKMLQHERAQRQHLEEMVEQLARQHSHLEQAATRHRPNVAATSTTSDDEDNEFFDAQEETVSVTSQDESSFILKIPKQGGSKVSGSSGGGGGGSGGGGGGSGAGAGSGATGSKTIPGSGASGEPVQESFSSGEEGEEDDDDDDGNSELLVVAEQSTDMDVPDKSLTFGGSRTPIEAATTPSKVARKRRTRVPDKPNYPLNLWSVMKNCIGKELSKIPMPVNFNEPLSMLQRLTEDYEYTELLDAAAKCTDVCEQLAYVAAFTISSYSTTSNRTGKPFNPLLGETYECDRTDDYGWRTVAEQVSHHPPMAAIHCEGRGWRCWQEFTMTTKFRGKYLQLIPLGTAHVEFTASGNRFTWRKVTTTVHNIIVGKLWVDHHGDMEIVGQQAAKGIKCHLKYSPYSYFTRETQRRVKGAVMNRSGEVKWVLNGTWDNKMEIAHVLSTSGGGSKDNAVYKTGNYKTIWTRRPPPPDSDKYYNFTTLACQLNEPEEDVAPTDTRLRPDQRLMENGRWDESNAEKLRLEEEQRTRRRQREAEAEKAAAEGRPYPPYEPVWFTKDREEGTDNFVHVFKGQQYWECKGKQDWTRCPRIF